MHVVYTLQICTWLFFTYIRLSHVFLSNTKDFSFFLSLFSLLHTHLSHKHFSPQHIHSPYSHICFLQIQLFSTFFFLTCTYFHTTTPRPKCIPSQVFIDIIFAYFSSVQFSRVRLFATPWKAAHQAPLSITISRSLLKLTSIESVMPSNHLITHTNTYTISLISCLSTVSSFHFHHSSAVKIPQSKSWLEPLAAPICVCQAV